MGQRCVLGGFAVTLFRTFRAGILMIIFASYITIGLNSLAKHVEDYPESWITKRLGR